MKILVDGRRLFAPGERVRFIDEPVIEGMVSGTNIRDRGRTLYDVVFWNSDSVHCTIEAEEYEIEAVDVPARKD